MTRETKWRVKTGWGMVIVLGSKGLLYNKGEYFLRSTGHRVQILSPVSGRKK